MVHDPAIPLVVTSDVHLGSRHCRAQAFAALLNCLPPRVALALNGDTFDDPRLPLPAEHAEILRHLRGEARNRPLYLIEGNHDRRGGAALLPEAHDVPWLEVPTHGMLILHGDGLDTVMPAHRWFIRIFRRLHRLRVVLGADNIHVAEYAKRWQWAYQVLVRRQRANAVAFAVERGVRSVACGHVHCMQDIQEDGIRYLNTGAWTEAPTGCLVVTESQARLVDAEEVGGLLARPARQESGPQTGP